MKSGRNILAIATTHSLRSWARPILLGLVIAVPSIAAAQVSSAPQVVASGLNNPRGLAFDGDGHLYVAESGSGGDAPCVANPEPNAPPLRCFGSSGALVRVDLWSGLAPAESWRRVVSGLPSLAAQVDNPATPVDERGSRAIGPVDVAFVGRHPFVLMAWGGNPAARSELGSAGRLFGTILAVHPNRSHGSPWHVVADVAAHENKNPDARYGGAVDSNPNGFVALPFRFVVADAGANDLVEAWFGGYTRTFALPAPRCVTLTQPPGPGPGGGDCPPGTWNLTSVPTTVTRGPDRAIYYSELTSFPFPDGGARLYRTMPWGGLSTIEREGLTTVIDVAFDDAGNSYVLEIARRLPPFGPVPSGRLLRFDATGASPPQVLATGLMFPAGVAIGPDHAAYVTNFSVFKGLGQVLRIPLP